jgi:hypothetical protein
MSGATFCLARWWCGSEGWIRTTNRHVLWAAIVLVSAGFVTAADFDGYVVSDQAEEISVLSSRQDQDAPDMPIVEGSSLPGAGSTHDGLMINDPSCTSCMGGDCTCGADQTGHHGRSCRRGWGAGGIINSILGEACPRWTAQADVLMLWQGNVPSRPLFFDTGTDLTVLDVNQMYAPVSVGPRVALLLHLDQTYAIEANYFQVQGFNGGRSLPVDAPYGMSDLAGYTFNDVDSAEALTSAGISSFELNWRRWNCRNITWLAGFRWVQWNETLGIQDEFNDGTTTGVDTIGIQTGNDLYGAQVGMDAMLLNLKQVVRFNGVAKAGVYGNQQAQATAAFGGDRMTPEIISVASNPVAFFGEIGINGSVRLSDHWSWRAGYNFFWLSGVATAAKQLNTIDTTGTTPSKIDTTGSVLLSGVNTGFEFIW